MYARHYVCTWQKWCYKITCDQMALYSWRSWAPRTVLRPSPSRLLWCAKGVEGGYIHRGLNGPLTTIHQEAPRPPSQSPTVLRQAQSWEQPSFATASLPWRRCRRPGIHKTLATDDRWLDVRGDPTVHNRAHEIIVSDFVCRNTVCGVWEKLRRT